MGFPSVNSVKSKPERQPDLNFIAPLSLEECIKCLEASDKPHKLITFPYNKNVSVEVSRISDDEYWVDVKSKVLNVFTNRPHKGFFSPKVEVYLNRDHDEGTNVIVYGQRDYFSNLSLSFLALFLFWLCYAIFVLIWFRSELIFFLNVSGLLGLFAGAGIGLNWIGYTVQRRLLVRIVRETLSKCASQSKKKLYNVDNIDDESTYFQAEE